MDLDSRFLILNQKSCIFGEKLIHNEESVFLFSELAFRQFWSRKLLLHAKHTKELGRGDAELYNGTTSSKQTVENGWFENTPFL